MTRSPSSTWPSRVWARGSPDKPSSADRIDCRPLAASRSAGWRWQLAERVGRRAHAHRPADERDAHASPRGRPSRRADAVRRRAAAPGRRRAGRRLERGNAEAVRARRRHRAPRRATRFACSPSRPSNACWRARASPVGRRRSISTRHRRHRSPRRPRRLRRPRRHVPQHRGAGPRLDAQDRSGARRLDQDRHQAGRHPRRRSAPDPQGGRPLGERRTPVDLGRLIAGRDLPGSRSMRP